MTRTKPSCWNYLRQTEEEPDAHISICPIVPRSGRPPGQIAPPSRRLPAKAAPMGWGYGMMWNKAGMRAAAARFVGHFSTGIAFAPGIILWFSPRALFGDSGLGKRGVNDIQMQAGKASGGFRRRCCCIAVGSCPTRSPRTRFDHDCPRSFDSGIRVRLGAADPQTLSPVAFLPSNAAQTILHTSRSSV
jgi:hypothetical protein